MSSTRIASPDRQATTNPATTPTTDTTTTTNTNTNNDATSGGYEADFSPPLEDKYKCPVCWSALRDPIQTKCGHRLCFSCFKQIRGGQWYFRCPIDLTW
jgi:hypothetical protein